MSHWDATEIFANIEYEVDELNRDCQLLETAEKAGIKTTFIHDQCVVEPGAIKSNVCNCSFTSLIGKAGKSMSVYSPWFRKWIALVQEQASYLDPSQKPSSNPSDFHESHKQMFKQAIPDAPESHSLAPAERERFAALWPAGEHAAKERLVKFCNERIRGYALHRSEPGAEATSCLSVHLSQGTISARACIRQARATNTSKKLDKGIDGNISWISEVAWRDFYRRM
jgi:deoxyribodipyrimidine photo-lyase